MKGWIRPRPLPQTLTVPAAIHALRARGPVVGLESALAHDGLGCRSYVAGDPLMAITLRQGRWTVTDYRSGSPERFAESLNRESCPFAAVESVLGQLGFLPVQAGRRRWGPSATSATAVGIDSGQTVNGSDLPSTAMQAGLRKTGPLRDPRRTTLSDRRKAETLSPPTLGS